MTTMTTSVEATHRAQVVPLTASDLALRTRLTIPSMSEHHLHRDRLLDVLSQATGPFVLMSAPAGSGKTALAAEWVTSRCGPRRVVWVDCQDTDHDPWADVLAGLGRSVAPRVARTDTATRPGAAGLRRFLETAEPSADPWTVVLDGYQLTSLEAAHDVDLLLRVAEGRIRLVLLTRVDPVLPLHRYRLEGDVVELRARDLAFTDDEAATLLESCGVRLGTHEVHALNARLSGWAAGLRFAVPAMAGHPAPDELVATAVTYNGDINAYLVEEVLDAQPPRVRELVMATCVPDTLTPDLLEELTGGPAVPTTLALTRANVFLEVLPRGGASGLRYPPFFRDLVRAQLAYESPRRLVELHRLLAAWYARQDMWDQAVTHLAGAGDRDAVAEVLVRRLLLGRLLCEAPDGPLRAVAASSRRSVPGRSPEVDLVAATVALLDHDREIFAARLTAAQQGSRSEAVEVTAAVLEACAASSVADAPTAVALTDRAKDVWREYAGFTGQVTGEDLAAVLTLSRARAAMRRGALGEATALLEQTLVSSPGSWSPLHRSACLAHLALLDARDGSLAKAAAEAAQALSLTEGQQPSRHTRAAQAVAHLAAAMVALETYDLAAVRRHLAEASPCEEPLWRVVAKVGAAALARSEGALEPSAVRLDAAVPTAVTAGPWLVGLLRLERARARLARGRPQEALAVLDEVPVDSLEASVVRASAELACGRRAAARARLAQIRAASTASVQREVAARLLEAAVVADTSEHRARTTLACAVQLGQREGLARPFREADPVVAAMLAGNRGRGGVDVVQRPRPVAAAVTSLPEQRRPPSLVSDAATAGPERVVDSLTPRELEVLACMSEWLTTPEIADKLFVSVNTVRTHVRNILTKLGVTRRNAAIREAQRRGLLPR